MGNRVNAQKKDTSPRKHRMLWLDLAMGIVMLSMIRAEAFGNMAHRIGGIALCVMTTAHIWKHRTWFKALSRGRWTRRREAATAITILPGFLLIAALAIGFFVPGTVSQFDRIAGLTPIGRAHHLLAVVAVAAIAAHAVYLGPLRRKRRRR